MADSISKIFLTLLLVLFLPATVVSAEATSSAREKFEEGVAALKAEDFETALEAFEASYALNPKPVVRYNIGMCQKALRKYREALETFSLLLDTPAVTLSKARLQEAEKTRKALETLVGRVTISKGTAGAEVFFDARSVGVLPLDSAVLDNPGEHVVEVRKEGFEPFRETLVLAEGDDIALAVPPLTPIVAEVSQAPPKPAGELGTPTPTRADAPPNRSTDAMQPNARRTRLLFGAGVASLALGVGGIVTAGVHTYLWNRNMGDINDIVTQCRETWRANCRTEYNEFSGRLRTNEAALITGYVVGGALVAAGTALLFIYRHQKKQKRRAVATVFPWGAGVAF